MACLTLHSRAKLHGRGGQFQHRSYHCSRSEPKNSNGIVMHLYRKELSLVDHVKLLSSWSRKAIFVRVQSSQLAVVVVDGRRLTLFLGQCSRGSWPNRNDCQQVDNSRLGSPSSYIVESGKTHRHTLTSKVFHPASSNIKSQVRFEAAFKFIVSENHETFVKLREGIESWQGGFEAQFQFVAQKAETSGNSINVYMIAVTVPIAKSSCQIGRRRMYRVGTIELVNLCLTSSALVFS